MFPIYTILVWFIWFCFVTRRRNFSPPATKKNKTLTPIATSHVFFVSRLKNCVFFFVLFCHLTIFNTNTNTNINTGERFFFGGEYDAWCGCTNMFWTLQSEFRVNLFLFATSAIIITVCLYFGTRVKMAQYVNYQSTFDKLLKKYKSRKYHHCKF